MYIANISFFVKAGREGQWEILLRQTVIPSIEARLGRTPTLSRVLSSAPCDHFTFSLMLELEDIPQFNTLTGQCMKEYGRSAGAVFGEDVTWMPTLMKILNR